MSHFSPQKTSPKTSHLLHVFAARLGAASLPMNLCTTTFEAFDMAHKWHKKIHKNGKTWSCADPWLVYESEPDLCFFWNGRVSAQANNDWATHQTNKILVLPQSPTINQVHFLLEHENPKTSWARKKIPSFPMKRWLRMGYPAGWVHSTLYPTENHTL